MSVIEKIERRLFTGPAVLITPSLENRYQYKKEEGDSDTQSEVDEIKD
ncbi:MAG: hypothetical protein IRZ08_18455 [Frankia sp.]|nr:hypothetical protein [Frankia sp.]